MIYAFLTILALALALIVACLCLALARADRTIGALNDELNARVDDACADMRVIPFDDIRNPDAVDAAGWN